MNKKIINVDIIKTIHNNTKRHLSFSMSQQPNDIKKARHTNVNKKKTW